MSKTPFQADLLEAAQSKLPDDGLRAARQAVLRDAMERGFPTTRDEDWRYTNLSAAAELSNTWLRELVADGAHATAAAPAEIPSIDGHTLLLVDGCVDEVALQRAQQALGSHVSIQRLRERADAVKADGPLDSLNAAMLQDGLYVRVAAGCRPDKPLALVLHDGAVAASNTRIVIDVEDGAALDIVEYHVGGAAAAHFANNVIQLTLGDNATVNFVRVQQRNAQHVQVGKLTAVLGQDASFSHVAFDLGGALVRNDLIADIQRPGGEVNLHGLYLADGEQHIDNHTRVDHRVGPAASREEYRGILNGRARCVFNGKAIVHKGADGTDAQQANHNLLLSDKAEVDTKPELEIYADDVKCAHGATVGELDDAAIFYMQSRGLDRDQAAHMLTRAFAAQVLSALPIVALHPHLEALIDARLDRLLEEPQS